MRRRKVERRKKILQNTKNFSIRVQNTQYFFEYDRNTEEFYLKKNGKCYRMANEEEVIYGIICNYSYLECFILDPDEEMDYHLSLNHFKFDKRPW